MSSGFVFSLLSPARLSHVVDIGANPIDGAAPYENMADAGFCMLTGFEPQTDALLALEACKRPHDVFMAHAVGDGAPVLLNICDYSGWSSALVPDARALEQFSSFASNARVIGQEPIETVRLDEIALRAPIDMLKIDIQGGELSVFQNARKSLAQAVVVQTEISYVPLYEGQSCFGMTDVELRQQGFIPHCFVAQKSYASTPEFENQPELAGRAQLLEADLVYVKNYLQHETLSDEQLKHMASLMHYCYGAYDLVLRCIRWLEARGALAQGSSGAYLQHLPPGVIVG